MRDPEEIRQEALDAAAARLASRGLLTTDRMHAYSVLKNCSERAFRTVRNLNFYGEYLYEKKKGHIK